MKHESITNTNNNLNLQNFVNEKINNFKFYLICDTWILIKMFKKKCNIQNLYIIIKFK